MSNVKILVVDDEPDILKLLEMTLNKMGLTVYTAPTLGAAKSVLEKNTFHFCLTDMKLPDGNGIELVEHVHKNFPKTPIAVITAYGTIHHAVEALKKGAFDFISKPISLHVLRNLVANGIKEFESPTNENSIPKGKTKLAGSSEYIQSINKSIAKLAKSQSTVYIEGPNCTSKKFIAQCIHNLSRRNDKEFISFDCIEDQNDSPEMSEYERLIAVLTEANGSTLFMENIGFLKISTQTSLAKILHDKSFTDEDNEKVNLDVRFIVTCNHNIDEAEKIDKFNSELMERMTVIKLFTRPLADHKDDIPGLSKAILTEYAEKWQQLPCKIDSQALHTLCSYNFPGNILELKSILERAANVCENDIIRETDLGFDDNQQPKLLSQRHNKNLEEYINEIEIQEITNALKLTNNNKTAAAKVLGISFRALRYRIKKLGL